jgi:type IV secretory pathway VirB10-like protein
MNSISRLGFGAALLVLVTGCGGQSASEDNQAVSANDAGQLDDSMMVDLSKVNEQAAAPSVEPVAPDEPQAVKTAPASPKAPPPAPPKAAPKAPPKAEGTKAAPKPKALPAPPADPHVGHDMNEM